MPAKNVRRREPRLLSLEEFDHCFTENDGVKLHYVESGAGRVILFLHGFPESWYAWKKQLTDLGRDHHVAALDMRGYGLSEKPRRLAEYEIGRLVEDVREVLYELSGGERAILVGHDWGGIVAWFFASRFPQDLDRLVIINAPHPTVFAKNLLTSPRQQLASAYALFFQLPWIAEKALTFHDFALLKAMVFGTARPEAFDEADRNAYREAWSIRGAIASGLKYYRANSVLRWGREELAKITTPTLVLWGENDRALLASSLHGLEDYVADLEFRGVPGATHWIAHERAAVVNDSIRAFIESGDRAQR